ncbi:hypothetical protein [Bacteroides fragilis]|jgi:hypothetical protein|uniref:hypothetical protein n=1 Tax=Bacteroides fragilis TaxID=817 RepID=UPI001C730935|nr:hypothetical protein [Bacteroides fragilis]MCM0335712.1 hypothetical protein [Bacteroides fragilis]
MKKILFNDKLGLTQAVLDGRKTMTRRIVALESTLAITWDCVTEIDRDIAIKNYIVGNIKNRYEVGEVVAIAQCYMDIDQFHRNGKNAAYLELLPGLKLYPGWGNKMFVRSDLMLHHIRITDIKVERLKGISDTDCLREGIVKGQCGSKETHFMDAYYLPVSYQPYCTPQEAFSVLIDKISGRGTWESNPYVWVYEFELVD